MIKSLEDYIFELKIKGTCNGHQTRKNDISLFEQGLSLRCGSGRSVLSTFVPRKTRQGLDTITVFDEKLGYA